MVVQRIIDAANHEDDTDEQIIEITLRPQKFDDYVGQERLKKNLKLMLLIQVLYATEKYFSR